MSIIYSYEIIFKAENVDNILSDLEKILDIEKRIKNKKKLPKSREWEPARILEHENVLIKSGFKGGEDYFFNKTGSLNIIPPDDPEFLKISDETSHITVYLDIQVGKKWGILDIIANLSSVSHLFDTTAFKHHIAKRMNQYCEAIILEKEAEGICELIHPIILSFKPIRRTDDFYYSYYQDELKSVNDIEMYAEAIMEKIKKHLTKCICEPSSEKLES